MDANITVEFIIKDYYSDKELQLFIDSIETLISDDDSYNVIKIERIK